MNRCLKSFVDTLTSAIDNTSDESVLLGEVSAAMRALVATDDWLPASHAAADTQRYQQHLLHLDPHRRFSVVSFVWGPGQRTPIHDHTTWGVIGMLRGTEVSQRYRLEDDVLVENGPPEVLRSGDVACVSPLIGDIHRVHNGLADRASISIHAYGNDIGTCERHVFDPHSHVMRLFVSGYAPTPALALSA